jgi:hypothetical protein
MYFGVEAGLITMLTEKGNLLSRITAVELAFNIYGLPLFASSSYSLWPVLCYETNLHHLKCLLLLCTVVIQSQVIYSSSMKS